MAAKGTIGKQTLMSKLASVYDGKFLGIVEGKAYIQVPDEGGEEVVIAVSLTCPKTLPAGLGQPKTNAASEPAPEFVVPTNTTNYKLSEDEEKTVSDLLISLGL